MKKRLFSVPYNNSEAEDWLIKVYEPYKENIDNVYFGVPFLTDGHQSLERRPDGKEKASLLYDNTIDFLNQTEGKFKRIVTLNKAVYPMSLDERNLFINDVIRRLVETYRVDGFILTDFYMARMIHQRWPHLELHTSCNCFQWNLATMRNWQEIAGISVFNPPREILRTPERLKEMHDAGFKLKCLVNEGCLYGCPSSVNHSCLQGLGYHDYDCYCHLGKMSNGLRGNWVLPRWLPKLDKYVDIYKFTGRILSTNFMVRCLDAYVNLRDDIGVNEIVIGGSITTLKHYVRKPLLTSDIHDDLLICEAKRCATCKKCDKLIAKWVKEGRLVFSDTKS